MHVDQVLGDHTTERYVLRITLESAGMPGASAIAGIATPNKLRSTKQKLWDMVPGKQSLEVPYRLVNIGINFAVGTYNRLAPVAGVYGQDTTDKTKTQPAEPKPKPTTSRDSGGSGGNKPAGAGATYTVKAGDTLGNIAYKYGTTASALGAANGIKDLNLIRPGQVLRIPGR